VALLTAKPPHIHHAIYTPICGIAVTKLHITVTPQKLIWPQGKTYPKKAVAIKIIYIAKPEYQRSIRLYALKYKFLNIWE
jgi:hypothetical protein